MRQHRTYWALMIVTLAAAAVWIWWDALKWPSIFRESWVAEAWVHPIHEDHALTYRNFKIVLANGNVVHARGTHYYWEQGGVGLIVRNGQYNPVYTTKDENVQSVEEER